MFKKFSIRKIYKGIFFKSIAIDTNLWISKLLCYDLLKNNVFKNYNVFISSVFSAGISGFILDSIFLPFNKLLFYSVNSN